MDKKSSSLDNVVNMNDNTVGLKAGPLLTISGRIVKKNWRTILAIVLLVYLPFSLIMELSPLAGKAQDLDGMMTVVRFQGLYELLVGAFAYILLASLVRAELDGKPVDFKSLWSMHFNGKVYVRYIWTMLVSGLLSGLLFLALIVPGVIFAVYWAFAGLVSIYEDEGGMKAMQMSKAMVKGRWWKIVWICLAGAVSLILPCMVLALAMSILADHWSTNLVGDIIEEFGAAVYVIYLAVAYATLRSAVDFQNMSS